MWFGGGHSVRVGRMFALALHQQLFSTHILTSSLCLFILLCAARLLNTIFATYYGSSSMLSAAIRIGVTVRRRPLFMSSASLFFLSSPSLSHPALIPSFSPFSFQSSMSPNCSLMPPNTQSSFSSSRHFLFCMQAPREGNGWKALSAPLSQKTGDSSPFMFPSPSSHKKHTYTWGGGT